MMLNFYFFTFAYIFIRSSTAEYITTYVYPDTLEQCASYLVPIATAIYPSAQQGCVPIDSGGGIIQSSYWVRCGTDGFSYYKDTFSSPDCSGSKVRENFSYNSTCSLTNYLSPTMYTPVNFNVIQNCTSENPTKPKNGVATLSVDEYMSPTCSDVTMLSPASTTTSYLNTCQNSGGSPSNQGYSFIIQCDSNNVYISNYTGYGCLLTQFVASTPLLKVGCSPYPSDATRSIVVSCSSGSSPPPQPSNDIWTIITQSPYFIDGIAVCAGFLGGGFIVCFCICMCRRRNRKNRNKRPTSPSPYNTSLQPNAVVVDGIGTPLRSDVLPGLSTPSSQSQSNQGGIRTPLLSQSGGEERGFVDDDSEA